MKLDRIHQIAVYARDLDEATTFYRDKLGARFLHKFAPPGLVFFDFLGGSCAVRENGSKGDVVFLG